MNHYQTGSTAMEFRRMGIAIEFRRHDCVNSHDCSSCNQLAVQKRPHVARAAHTPSPRELQEDA